MIDLVYLKFQVNLNSWHLNTFICDVSVQNFVLENLFFNIKREKQERDGGFNEHF